MKKEFFPKVSIEKDKLIFNAEAIETMELDVKDSRVLIIETTNVEKKKQPKEILIIKTNGSLCDDPENIKDVFSPELIRTVNIQEKDGEIVSGYINLNPDTTKNINSVFGESKEEFKLLVCNIESPLGKEFKEQFDISSSFYRFAYMSDKRISIGKEKNMKEKNEERVSIN
jgi:hypothetical protein